MSIIDGSKIWTLGPKSGAPPIGASSGAVFSVLPEPPGVAPVPPLPAALALPAAPALVVGKPPLPALAVPPVPELVPPDPPLALPACGFDAAPWFGGAPEQPIGDAKS